MNQNDMGETPATVRQPAQRYVMPHEMQLERVSGLSSGVTFVFPEVRGGVCEFCGVIDGNYPSEMQYKMCPHYRGKQLLCSYCPAEKNQDEIIRNSIMRVLQHPDKANTLIVHCNSYECKKKHEEKWKVS